MLVTTDNKGPIVYYVPPPGGGGGFRGGVQFSKSLKGGGTFLLKILVGGGTFFSDLCFPRVE